MKEFIKVMRALPDFNRVKLLKLLEKREEDLCRLTESETWIGSGGWFRKSAGVVIGLLGIYFIGSPFLIG
jgi:hypothetical protein